MIWIVNSSSKENSQNGKCIVKFAAIGLGCAAVWWELDDDYKWRNLGIQLFALWVLVNDNKKAALTASDMKQRWVSLSITCLETVEVTLYRRH